MSKKNYIAGFPRIGEQRELKKVLESFWAKESSFEKVNKIASELKKDTGTTKKMQALII